MGCKNLLLICLFVTLPAHVQAAEADLCAALRAFRTAPFEKDAENKPLRRIVELHYIGEWLVNWRKECRHFDRADARTLCPTLINNSNFEFQDILPRSILTCYGWKTPVGTNGWDIERAVITLDTDERGRKLPEDVAYRVTLEIDHRWRKKPHTAIRLSVIPWGEGFKKSERLVDEPDNPPIESDIEP